MGFPNNKYHPNTKNYLPCFVLGGGLVLGGRDYRAYNITRVYIYIYITSYYIYPYYCINPYNIPAWCLGHQITSDGILSRAISRAEKISWAGRRDQRRWFTKKTVIYCCNGVIWVFWDFRISWWLNGIS